MTELRLIEEGTGKNAVRTPAVFVEVPWSWKEGKWEGDQWTLEVNSAYDQLVDKLSTLADVSHIKFTFADSGAPTGDMFVAVFPEQSENLDILALRGAVAQEVDAVLKDAQAHEAQLNEALEPQQRTSRYLGKGVAEEGVDPNMRWILTGNPRVYAADVVARIEQGQLLGLPSMRDTFALAHRIDDRDLELDGRITNAKNIVSQVSEAASGNGLDMHASAVLSPMGARVFLGGQSIPSDISDEDKSRICRIYARSVRGLREVPQGVSFATSRTAEEAVLSTPEADIAG